MLILKAKQ